MVDGGSTDVRFAESYWTVVFLCWLLYVFTGAYQIAPASILPVIGEELSLGPTAASWVTSVLFLSMAATAIPIGMALDGVDNRTGLVVGSAGVFLATLWGWHAAATGAYLSLLASRLFAGPAVVTIWTASVNSTGNVAARTNQATVITLYATSVPLGFAVGQFATPVVTGWIGWELAMLPYGVIAVVIATGFWFVSREYEINAAGESRPSRAEFAAVFRHRGVWGVATLAFIAISLMFIINNWMPTYFRDRYQLSLARSGLFAAIFPAIGIFSRAFSGALSDRGFGGRRKPLVVLAFLVTAPATVGIVLVDSVALTLACLLVAGFFSQIGQVLLFVYVRELVSPNVVGTALAVVNAMGFLGAFVAPILTGALIELSGSYLLTFAAGGAISVLAVLVTLLVPESEPIDGGAPDDSEGAEAVR